VAIRGVLASAALSATYSSRNPITDVRISTDYDSAASETCGINEAVDSLSAGGGAVFIPPGLHDLYNAIKLTKNKVMYFGAGPSTILRIQDDRNTHSIRGSSSINPSVEDIIIRDLVIDNNIDNHSVARDGIYVDSFQDCLVENVRFVNCRRGITLEDVAGGANRSRISGCRFTEIEDYGIWAQTSTDVYIEDSYFSIEHGGVYGYGVYPTTGTSDMFIKGNSFFNCDVGIDTDQALDNMHIENNKFRANTVGGIMLQGDITNSSIRNNIMEATGGGAYGIWVLGATNTIISNNIVYDTDYIGISVGEDTVGCTIANNICQDTGSGDQDYGIWIYGAADEVLIHGNICRGNMISDIEIDGDATNITEHDNVT
jgi:parallel beta-helix repeat protein